MKKFSSNSILKLVEKDHYSHAHNERVKVQKLNEINLKIKTLAELKNDVITSKKSQNDKRIRLYTIDKKIFFKKK